MPPSRFQRLLPLSGALFSSVMICGLVLTSGEPDNNTTRDQIFSYWHDHHGLQLVSNLLLIPFGSVFLLLFTVELRRVLRSSEADEAIYSPLALAGGILVAAGLGVTGSLGAAVATAAHHHDESATYTLAQLQSYDWVPWMVGFGVLLLASGIGGLRTRALPKALAIPAAVLGIACLTPLGFFALFAIPVWTAAAGIVLYRAERSAARARVGRAAAGLAMLLALVVLGTAGAASATAPGKNGSIAFRRFFDDQHTWSALFTIAPDGTHSRQVTRPPRGTVDNSPDWSPDGRLIAFVRYDGTSDTGLEHLWVVRPDGSGLAPIGPVCPSGADEATCPDDTDPSFASDSTQLTFVQASGTVKTLPGSGREIEHSAIAVVNVDGSGRRVVYQTAPYSGDVAAPMLSPDGAEIVFERDNSSAGRPAGAKAVFVVASNGSGAHRLTPWAENSGDNPDWSPDGQWILFHSHVDDGRQGQYFLIHPDGSGRKQLSHYPNGTFIGSASFSPDGHTIVFAKGPQGGNIDVYTMRLDGTHLRRLTYSRLWDSAPDWGPVAASADRTVSNAAAGFPSGSWRVTVTTHDLVSRGVTGSDVPGNRGVWTWTFNGPNWIERQRETATGPVTDTHHGRIALKGTRVCFTDTGEHVSLGCYDWSRAATTLLFANPTVTGPLSQGDGPAILRAVFTAHPWRRIARTPASATNKPDSGAAPFTLKSTLDGKTVLPIRVHWIARPSLRARRSVRASHAAAVRVTSSLDQTSVLPHRIPWQAKTNIPAASVEEVDFLIDGKLRWVEHNAPYWYGSDGDWLVTSFLPAGVHRFTVRVKTINGQSVIDTHGARVGMPPSVPANLAGNWAQSIGAARAGAFAGTWHLRITPAGWHTLDPKGGVGMIDVAYLRGDLLESRSPIWTNPAGPPGSPTEGNGWCDAPYPPVRYHFVVSDSVLTLQLVGSDRCGGEHVIWAGTWHRSR